LNFGEFSLPSSIESLEYFAAQGKMFGSSLGGSNWERASLHHKASAVVGSLWGPEYAGFKRNTSQVTWPKLSQRGD